MAGILRPLLWRQVLLVVLLGAPPTLVLSQESDVNYPVGCFNFGYQYEPHMANISGMPYTLGSVTQCQMKCRATFGCYVFAYFTESKECWLGGVNAHLVRANAKGVIAGPSNCATDPPACRVIPGPNFPGTTPDASRAAWPEIFEEPTNLQCWPRRENGFPDKCNKQLAKVLEDTHAGWPGRCDMENFRIITDLESNETCQMRCFKSTLCGVWMIQNSSGTDVCYQSMSGMNCYKSTGPAPKRAQRIMHGTYRKLMETTGVQIKNLVQAFEVTPFPKWEDGAERCRLSCLSYLFCQFWQYSSVYGCWIEESGSKLVEYPLYNNGNAINMTNGASVKAGEYVQHTCPATLTFSPPPLDTVAATDEQDVNSAASVLPQAPTLGAAPLQDDTGGGGGMPPWVSILVGLLVALCLVAACVGVFFMLKKGDKKGGKKSRAAQGYSDVNDTRNSSFESQASGASFMPQQGGYGYQGQQYNHGYGQQQGYGHHYPQQYAGYGHVPQNGHQMPGTYRGWG